MRAWCNCNCPPDTSLCLPCRVRTILLRALTFWIFALDIETRPLYRRKTHWGGSYLWYSNRYGKLLPSRSFRLTQISLITREVSDIENTVPVVNVVLSNRIYAISYNTAVFRTHEVSFRSQNYSSQISNTTCVCLLFTPNYTILHPYNTQNCIDCIDHTILTISTNLGANF